MKKVMIIMGSDSDLPVMEKAFPVLDGYGIPWEAHICSAHRTPEAAAELAISGQAQGFGVFIAGAGMAAHLAGALAARTILPVIGVPLKSAVLEGMDALLSTVQMPPGIPVATVAINGAANAGELAAQILALEDPVLASRLEEKRRERQAQVEAKDAALAESLNK